MSPARPALRWHGGKWRLAPWIVSHLPRHRVYVEPFGGAASVLLRKPRSYAEIYNDLDAELVAFFRVLRDPAGATRLAELLALTPFARDEFEAAYAPAADPVEAARRLVVRSFMGFGSDGTRVDRTTGFRSNSNRSGTTPARDWSGYPANVAALCIRLRGVVLENRVAAEVIAMHDGPDTLHYVDPPYVPATRQLDHRLHGYKHELTEACHLSLLEQLRSLHGAVVLSGYPSEVYDDGLPGWRRVECAAMADGARPRREVLWINPRAVAMADQQLLRECAA